MAIERCTVCLAVLCHPFHSLVLLMNDTSLSRTHTLTLTLTLALVRFELQC